MMMKMMMMMYSEVSLSDYTLIKMRTVRSGIRIVTAGQKTGTSCSENMKSSGDEAQIHVQLRRSSVSRNAPVLQVITVYSH